MSLYSELQEMISRLNVLEDAQEELTEAITIINSDHKLIHDRYGYGFMLKGTVIADGASVSYSWTTPTARYPHVKDLQLTVLGASCRIEIIEDATITSDTGTLVPLRNKNRVNPLTAESVVRESPVYSGGTVIEEAETYADSTTQNKGVTNITTNPNQENVLDKDKTYIIKISNIHLSDNTINWSVRGFFYEETRGAST